MGWPEPVIRDSNDFVQRLFQSLRSARASFVAFIEDHGSIREAAAKPQPTSSGMLR